MSVLPSSVPSTITVPGGGTVTLVAKASDNQGVQDVQLWIGTRSCSFTGGIATCSGPGLLGAPTASNRDSGTAGRNGCTERLVKENLVVRNTSTGSVSHDVQARGENFGGREVRTPFIHLQAQC